MKWLKKGHEYGNIAESFKARPYLLIYGANLTGSNCLAELKSIKWFAPVDGFIDDSTQMQEQGFRGLKVYSPDDDIVRQHKCFILIAVDEPQRSELIELLVQKLYVKNTDFMFCEEFVNSTRLQILYNHFAKNKTYMESGCIVPSTICNLNCKGCLNFNNDLNKNKRHIVKSFDAVKEEIDLIFEYVDYTPRLQISGGEPLLYKDLIKVIEYIGDNYRDKIGDFFEIVTNGTIVPSEDIYNVLKKYDMYVYVDKYTENVPKSIPVREEIFRKLTEYEIRNVDNVVERWFDLKVGGTDNTAMTEDERIRFFNRCANPWNCFEGNRVNACNFANFADKAGVIPLDDDDYFVMKHNPTISERTEFFEFINGFNDKGYVNLCLHCAGWSLINKNTIPIAEQF
jgi:hypothetical protein